mgnify:CR=1 FL=1
MLKNICIKGYKYFWVIYVAKMNYNYWTEMGNSIVNFAMVDPVIKKCQVYSSQKCRSEKDNAFQILHTATA